MAQKTKDQLRIEELKARITQLEGIIEEMDEAYSNKLNEEETPAILAIRESVDLIDPSGRGHVPSGSLGVYQDVLDKLNGALVAVDAASIEQETE